MSNTNDEPAIGLNGYAAFRSKAVECETKFLQTFGSEDPRIIGEEAADTLKRLRSAIYYSKDFEGHMIKPKETVDGFISDVTICCTNAKIDSAIYQPVIAPLVDCWTKFENPTSSVNTFETQVENLKKADKKIGDYVSSRYLERVRKMGTTVFPKCNIFLEEANTLIEKQSKAASTATENPPTSEEPSVAEPSAGQKRSSGDQGADTNENTSQASETPSTGSKRLKITFVDLLNPLNPRDLSS